MKERFMENEGFTDKTTIDWFNRFLAKHGGAVNFDQLNEAFLERFKYGLENHGFVLDHNQLITGLLYKE